MSSCHEYRRLLIEMFECPSCQSNNIGKYNNCCIGSMLRSNLWVILPTELICIIHGFSLSAVHPDFLTRAINPCFGLVQAYVKKTDNNKYFEFYLEHKPPGQKTDQEVDETVVPTKGKSKNNRIVSDHVSNLLTDQRDVLLMTAQQPRHKKQKQKQYTIFNGKDRQTVLGSLKCDATNFTLIQLTQNQQQEQEQHHGQRRYKATDSGVVQYTHFYEHGSPWHLKVLLPHRSFDKSANPFQVGTTSSRIVQQYEQEHKNDNNINEIKQNDSNVQQNDMSNGLPARKTLEKHQLYDFESKDCQIECYENLVPQRNDHLQVYVMRFDHARVQVKSSKNFKMIRSTIHSKRRFYNLVVCMIAIHSFSILAILSVHCRRCR